MPKVIITVQEEGDEKLSFEIHETVIAKMQDHINQVNASSVLGIHYEGKADFFAKECLTKILKPLMDNAPDAPPAEAIEKLAQAETLKEEAAAITAAAAVIPIRPI